jgi:hypothetical protein
MDRYSARLKREIGMDAMLTIVVLTIVRLVIPLGLMLTVGSLLAQRQSSHS